MWKRLYTVQYYLPTQRNELLRHATASTPHGYREKPVSKGHTVGFHLYNILNKTKL